MTTLPRPPVFPDATATQLVELQTIAEATLGRPVHDSVAFRRNCRRFGLGDSLNIEHDVAE